MKILFKLILALTIFYSFPFSAKAQTVPTLDEQLSAALRRNFPDWKSEKTPGFEMNYSGNPHAFGGSFKNGRKKLRIDIHLFKSKDETTSDLERFFYMRQIMPRSRNMTTVGDKSATVETSQRVEIRFVKENVVADLEMMFPNTDKRKKGPEYLYSAPDAEFEFTHKVANVIADVITGQKIVSPCFNNFIKFPYPPEITNEEKFRAAAYRGDNELVKNFISQGVNTNAKAADGDTALHLAIKQDCLETIKTIVEANADVNAKNEKGETPLMTAAIFGNAEAVKLLLSSGADVEAKNNFGRNAAFAALSGPNGNHFGRERPDTDKKIQILDLLKNAGSDLTRKEDFNGHTLLINFISGQPAMDEKLLDEFLSFGIDVNEKNNSGETALIKAATLLSHETRTAFVKYLLEHGADVNCKDNRGFTALDYLKQEEKRYSKDEYTQPGFRHFKETLELLIQAGAKE